MGIDFKVKANESLFHLPKNRCWSRKIYIEEELRYNEGFLKSVQKKLSNERFVNNAPEQVITNERKKEADALAKIETLKASLKSLG